jgi:hypothetical protein
LRVKDSLPVTALKIEILSSSWMEILGVSFKVCRVVRMLFRMNTIKGVECPRLSDLFKAS